MTDAREVVHRLKTWPTYWDAVERGDKLFEVRKNDRAFQTGDLVDLVRLDEDKPDAWVCKMAPLRFRIGWILQGAQFGIEPGYCVFSLAPANPEGPRGGTG